MKTRVTTAIAAVLLAATACAPIALTPPPLPPPFGGGVDPGASPRADDAAYAGAGPYAAGVTTVEITPGRQAEVWYPARPDDAVGVAPDVYRIKKFLSPFLQFLLPAEVDPPFETDAFRGLPVSPGGPFPVVLFSHGASSFRLQSTFLTTHLASWGFVVVSPDYYERGLQSLLGGVGDGLRPDTQVAELAVAKVRAMSTDAGGPFEGFAETDRFFPIGHSAGGGTSIALLSRPDVSAAIPMAAGVFPESGVVPDVLGDPTKTVMWMAGRDDGIAALDRVQAGFDYTAGPGSLVVIGGAGHNNAFSDICEIARDDGGIVTLALRAGLPLPDLIVRLGRDGCVAPPNHTGPEVWPIVRHFVTASLRFAAGVDPVAIGLGSGVVDEFSPAPDTYLHRP